MSKNIHSFLQLFIQKGLPFVLYRLPGGQEPVFVAQKTNELEKRKLSEIDMVNGFLLSEFSQMKSETFFFIRPDIVIGDGVFSEKLNGCVYMITVDVNGDSAYVAWEIHNTGYFNIFAWDPDSGQSGEWVFVKKELNETARIEPRISL